jgi:hypothetical protein
VLIVKERKERGGNGVKSGRNNWPRNALRRMEAGKKSKGKEMRNQELKIFEKR